MVKDILDTVVLVILSIFVRLCLNLYRLL